MCVCVCVCVEPNYEADAAKHESGSNTKHIVCNYIADLQTDERAIELPILKLSHNGAGEFHVSHRLTAKRPMVFLCLTSTQTSTHSELIVTQTIINALTLW